MLAGYKQCLQAREIHMRDSYDARDDAIGKSAWHQRVCVRDTRLALKVLKALFFELFCCHMNSEKSIHKVAVRKTP